MPDYQRYAIYWTPDPGSGLEAFGERWFGSQGESFGLPADLVSRATKAPARYRLHATLKAPFRLRDGVSASDLQAAIDQFCSNRRSRSGGTLTLATFQRYLGLVLSRETAWIDWLAEECVTHFDRFRAPLNQSDRDRRELGRLSRAEIKLLEEFGYPFVLSAFRFHISLAGPLSSFELEQVREALEPHLKPHMEKSFQIESLSLLGEPSGGGLFELISRHRLGHAPAARP
jgi:hypothetical protein